MGLIQQTKCVRCDRTYSSLRRKCPYCGTRKNRGGKRGAGTGNNRWQLIAGIVILLAIIITVVVLIVTSLKNNKEQDTAVKDPKTAQTAGEGVTSVTGTPAQTGQTTTPDGTSQTGQAGTTTVSPDPGTQTGTQTQTTTPPAPTVNSITLNRSDFTLNKTGDQWQMKATISPDDPNVTVTWKSNDESVCLISATGLVTAVGRGNTTIVATAGGKSAECIVRVKQTVGTVSTGTETGGTTGGNTSGGDTTGTVSLSHSDVTIHSGTSESFTLKVTGASGTPTFASDNSAIAKVDSSGKVTAVSNGDVNITVTVDGKTLKCIVRVRT